MDEAARPVDVAKIHDRTRCKFDRRVFPQADVISKRRDSSHSFDERVA